jgi:hypothetical protein
MNRHIIVLGLFLVTSLTSFIHSQTTVWFLNGDKMQVTECDINEKDWLITYYNKKQKEKIIDLDYVFSVTDSLGKEKVYYIPVKMEDSEDTFTVSQMRSFVEGEFDGNQEHKARLSFVSGILVGGSAGYLLSPSLLFYSPAFPAGAAVISGITQPKEKRIVFLHPEKKDDEQYIYGYQEAAKHKRAIASIKGGAIGLVLGIVAGIILVK